MKLLQLLADNLVWLAIFIALFSLLIGSFLNVVILRFPVMMFRSWKQDCLEMDSNLPKHPAIDDLSKPFNLLKPDSHCPKCQAPVRAWQNIPLLSWVLLRGKCAGCGTPIGLRYPAV